jgi:uncharacterized delta-60 repeat protein
MPAPIRSLVATFCILFSATPGAAAPGDLDPTFSTDGFDRQTIGVISFGLDVAIQSDGKIVLAGSGSVASSQHVTVLRYLTNGTLDPDFDDDGIVTTEIQDLSWANAVSIQTDGKIVVAGHTRSGMDYSFMVARYNEDGSLDTSFDSDGIAISPPASGLVIGHDLAIQSDGKLVVSGQAVAEEASIIGVARFNADGSLDSSFDGDGIRTINIDSSISDEAFGVAIQSDGKIVTTGMSNFYPDGLKLSVLRLNGDGTLDAEFDEDGIVHTSASPAIIDYGQDVEIQGDGKLVVTGFSRTDADPNQETVLVLRYNSDGSLDTSFDGDGKVRTEIGTFSVRGHDAIIDPVGRIVVVGSTEPAGGVMTVFRYSPDGSLDPTFDDDGIVTTAIGTQWTTARAVALQDTGRIVVGGDAKDLPPVSENLFIARYESDCVGCGSGCAGGTCDPMIGCVLEDGPRPANTCLEAGRAKLQVTIDDAPGRNKLLWKWGLGDAFDHAFLGAPDDSTSYSICLYDQTASVSARIAEYDLPTGAAWTDKDPKGFSYSDRDAIADGIKKLQLKPGGAGASKMLVKGAGIALPSFEPAAPETMFAQDPLVIIQLVSSDGACWHSQFAVGETRTNDGVKFSASFP